MIGVARDVSFAIQLRQDDGRSVRSHGDAFRIDPVLLEDEHPSIGSMEWNNTPFVTNHPVLHDIHRVELDWFPCSSLKSNRCSFHLDLYNVFTRSTTNSSSILSARSIWIDFILFYLFIYLFYFISFWHVSPILLC